MSTVFDRAGIETDNVGERLPDESGVRPLTVPPEDGGGRINLGAMRQLVVPAEDLDLHDGGQDLDFSAQMLATIGKLNRQWWFALTQNYWMSTRMVEVNNKMGGYGSNWYWVNPAIRHAIRDYVKDVMIIPCYLLQARVWNIWIVSVNSTQWWRSVEPLFRQPAEFYAESALRVIPDTDQGCYKFKHDLISQLEFRATAPSLPTRPVEQLFGETLGETRIIESLDHQVIRNLTRGNVLR